ncbi:Avirulence (Avh) protein [Phytophthora megakarya]|uniref:Avirulence (Avh) protein n=1 Tax=Phytophthora megakarya TaxID=4795 RepID=A0A225VT60_9STRA|nr:Avirulence (Avh) protein [Phytophthora megakarya]
MPVQFLVGWIVIALLAGVDAKLDSKLTEQEPIASDSFSESRTVVSENNVPRIGRLRRNKESNAQDAEERSPNVDLLILDGIHAIRKKTKWPAQFLALKLVKADPIAVGKKWGVIVDGIVLKGHKKWEKFIAYRDFYKN